MTYDIHRNRSGRRLTAALALTVIAWCAGARLAAADSGEVELRTPQLRAIERGQRYLVSRMNPNGYFGNGDGKSVAVSAAGILALMVTGNMPGEGHYGRQVGAAVRYLLSQSQERGLLAPLNTGQPMYHHGLGCLAVAEFWGQTMDPACKKVLKDGINLDIRTQNNRGGWRYQPRNTRNDDDISVTVMQAMALRAARNSGISVPVDTIKDAVNYIKECKTSTNNDLHLPGFSYTPGGNATFSTTAAGCMSLMICGEYKTDDVKDGLDYLNKSREAKDDQQRWYIYGHFYAAQAMYQAGGDYWRNWYQNGLGAAGSHVPGIAEELTSLQQVTGENAGSFNIKQRTGPAIYDDAMCVLILGIPYRYLPIYQR
ncbi:MAG: hypothetical protein ACREJ2_06400 [Planctomycetota bacterium]